MAARCNWSQPIYFARLHKFFRHFWQNLSKGRFGQLTTFPEDLFSPCMESSHTSAQRQRDKHCGSWHSHISCYRTCDSWTAISHCLHFPQSAAGRRRNVRIIKDRKSFFLMRSALGYPDLLSFFPFFYLLPARPRLWKRVFTATAGDILAELSSHSRPPSYCLEGAEPSHWYSRGNHYSINEGMLWKPKKMFLTAVLWQYLSTST